MKIDSYKIDMSSSSFSAKTLSVTEKTTIAVAAPQGNANSLLANGTQAASIFNQEQNNSAVLLTLSREAQEQFLQNQNNRQQTPAQTQESLLQSAQDKRLAMLNELQDEHRMKLAMLERLVSQLTGKPFKFSSILDNLKGQQQPLVQEIQVPQIIAVREVTTTYHETQSMSFAAQGVVNTSDGRQIKFDMNILANYEFSFESNVQEQIQLRLADPLVINFDGTLPEFTKDRYEFDITIDGNLENIFMPTNGSGFLALDKNGNGVIDDGSELFGAETGNGFYELAKYDDDGNGWIDENDAVFSELKIMFVDKSSGETMLVSLKDAGVGAIFLGSTNANYEIKAAGNETAGVVRKNGIFLNENGTAGTIHHIDLTY